LSDNQPSFLTKAQLLKLLNPDNGLPLVEGLLDPNVQVQPAGIDLSAQKVLAPISTATIGFTQAMTRLPVYNELEFDQDGLVHLAPGPYKIILNEIVHIPNNIVGIARPRSTIARSGADVVTALWDPGYSGRSEVLLVVHNPHGLSLYRNARIIQLCFWEVSQPLQEGTGYSGRYQLENINKPA
jgi:dUTP pyrophosphatase